LASSFASLEDTEMATTSDDKGGSVQSKNSQSFIDYLREEFSKPTVGISYLFCFVAVGLILLAFYFEGQTTRALFLAFGSSLLPMALLNIFFEHFSRQKLMDEFEQKVQGVIKKELKNRAIGSLDDLDSQLREEIELELLALVGEKRDGCLSELKSQLENFSQARLIASGIIDYSQLQKKYEVIFNLLAGAKNTIRVCKTWIPEIDAVHAALKEALREGSTIESVQILCLDPDSTLAKQRSLDMGETPDWGRKQIKIHLEKLHRLYEKDDRVKIYIYNSLPSVSLYAADDTALIGWYWHSQLSFDGPVLKVKGENYHLNRCVQENFDELLKAAKPYSPEPEQKES
jgi:hypothetical protein